MKLTVFSQFNNSRIQYSLNEICKRVGFLEFEIITDSLSFEQAQGEIKLNYSSLHFLNVFTIAPSGLLSETNIENKKLKWSYSGDLPVLFPVTSSSFSYDILAEVFFHLSRYEEYLPHERDQHGRYTYQSSLLYEVGIDKAYIERYCEQFRLALSAFYNVTISSNQQFKTYLTIDVDVAWAYKNKSYKITWGSKFKSALKGDFKKLEEQNKVLSQKLQDPFDTYAYLRSLVEENQLDCIYFFLLGDRSQFDRNIAFNHPELMLLIQSCEQYAQIGIHPSYNSFLNSKAIDKEINRLQKIISHSVSFSRQHYLRLTIPKSYQLLEELGVSKDFTMGYAEEIGFRAATCLPFNFYDLQNEKQCKLEIIPLNIMDGTLNEYLKLSPENAMAYSQKIIDEVKYYRGTLTLLWHNETVNDCGKWKNWRQVLEHQIWLAKN